MRSISDTTASHGPAMRNSVASPKRPVLKVVGIGLLKAGCAV